MSLFKTLMSLAVNNTKIAVKNNANSSLRPLLSCAPVAMVGFDRGAHSQDITKNIQYISNDKIKLTPDPKTMKLDKQLNRPICIMINWLLARQKHVLKYASLYLEQGFDVVSVSCTPWQLMWPMKGSQLVAGDLMRLLSANENDQPLVVHGFSVGGYLWGEVCAHVMADKERYQPVLDRVAAQVWDSAADITEITIGVPIAVFPKNKIMQKTLKAYMEYHMKTFHDAATTHYIRSSQLFHTNLCRAPALFLLSSSDPVGAEHSNRAVYQSWCKMGIKCTWQCWDRSPHVQHFSKHREEYVRLVMAHLREHALLAHKTRAHA
ncbi:PREDICTED: uncharacterized protein LOC106105586 [Papilio polytes]|uniref:uncharacterized protein LOC106105586 n=1 Tax=Papilio polytes TaxID=76194 RepID=UPI0006767726|nr:PREDICTED: uncharacterized protein LOC106105586 [Papilio polytes]